MSNSNFFEKPIGVFQGFSNSGLEFHADIMIPYRPELQVIPMHGTFLLVELENEDEAVLGRISSLQSMGRLSGSGGSEYAIRAMQRDASIPEDIKEDHLRYKIDIRVLGILRYKNDKIFFVPSHHRLPHVGSRVSFPDDTVLKNIALDADIFGMPIGHLALGEHIYCQGDNTVNLMPWHQQMSPSIKPRFDIKYLISRKTFIFARAGYGKSNLNKLLFSALYENNQPSLEWKDGTAVPVGALLFDPEGEYFWPDSNGRPGLADVPGLKERLMVFTDRQNPSEYYMSFVAGPAKMDLARMNPGDVLAMGLSSEDITAKWAARLHTIDHLHWAETIDLINENMNSTNLDELAEALGLEQNHSQRSQERWELTTVQLTAIRRELTLIVSKFHSSYAVTFEAILEGLRRGMIVVFDISQMNPLIGEKVTKQIVKKVFDNNQTAHTSTEEKPIPTILVIEEAQSVLGGARLDENDPVVEWVKQGRKYNLGAVMVTQQPGSISDRILSQGDNWFVFHLIAGGDLSVLKNANGHFSNDILQSLLNEPIKGQGYFWSSESERSYPIPIRILPFEDKYKLISETTKTPVLSTTVPEIVLKLKNYFYKSGSSYSDTLNEEKDELLKKIKNSNIFINGLKNDKMHESWAANIIKEHLDTALFNNERSKYLFARNMVHECLNYILGDGKWQIVKRTHNGKNTKFYKILD